MHANATQKIFIVLDLESGNSLAHLSPETSPSKHILSAHISKALLVKEQLNELFIVDAVVCGTQALELKLES